MEVGGGSLVWCLKRVKLWPRFFSVYTLWKGVVWWLGGG